MFPSALPAYEVVRSARRTLELRVYPDGRVQVRAPRQATEEHISQFIASRQDWLKRHLARLDARQSPVQLPLEDGATHPLLGRPVAIRLRLADVWDTELRGSELWIRGPRLTRERVAARLEAFLRVHAREQAEALIDRHFPWFQALGYRRPQLRIKRMRSRWGSLSTRGFMNLNLALVRLPLPCLEYVVVHELCHLVHMDHGPGFHRLMDQRLPDWRARRVLLNRLPALEWATG